MSQHRLSALASAGFRRGFAAEPTWLAHAPGRVNLMGEHTDYNGGFVLPCAINFGTSVALRARRDSTVRVLACDLGDARDEFDLAAPLQASRSQPWANYVRGVLGELRALGLPAVGMELAIAGDVPKGAGLSSSASLEVALATAVVQAFGLPLSPNDIALLAQRAENHFVGCNCGIMDQLISARGEGGHALLIDCDSLQTTATPMPADMAVMIVHSHVRRGLVDSAYNERRAQCEAAARHFGVPNLRPVNLAQLQQARSALDPLVWRRAHHVLTENERTLATHAALAAGDLPALGQLMAASHHSMRQDFEITVPAMDHLVQILQDALASQGGARMTGGGFGGCAVALLPQVQVAEVSAAVQAFYRSPEGEPASVWCCTPSTGARAWPLAHL